MSNLERYTYKGMSEAFSILAKYDDTVTQVDTGLCDWIAGHGTKERMLEGDIERLNALGWIYDDDLDVFTYDTCR
jgi:hypothetical protein